MEPTIDQIQYMEFYFNQWFDKWLSGIAITLLFFYKGRYQLELPQISLNKHLLAYGFCWDKRTKEFQIVFCFIRILFGCYDISPVVSILENTGSDILHPGIN
jgi:membrane-anchored glycerophosphoryl diester phosphodiesterase (GDPDase)